MAIRMSEATLEAALRNHVGAVETTARASSGVLGSIVAELVRCFTARGKVLACGNGGSAADAQHFVAEFMNQMRLDREPWPAIALTTDSSVMTSIANDRAFVDVFARQVEALGAPNDILVAFSTSGRSENVLAALDVAHRRGMVTVGFTGEAGKEMMGTRCDLIVVAASDDTPRIQECHGFLCHFIATEVEAALTARVDRSGPDR
jgi:D-sedoheptulose 7-phosphate isomerase